MKNELIDISSLYNLLNSKIINNCTIEITNVCSFFCSHCYIDKFKRKMMTFDEFKNIVNQLLCINCNSILITGGEPTLNPDFIKMYKYAKEKGMFVSINTNGFYFNNDIKNIFLKFKPNLIEITLYGYNKETYKKFTHVNDSYNGVINSIEFLSINGIKFNLKATLTKENYMYLAEMRKISYKYKCMFRYDYILFPKINEVNKGRNELSLTSKEIISVIKQDEGDTFYFKERVKEIQKGKNKNHYINKVFSCKIAKEIIYIDCNGFIKPCLVIDKKYNIISWKIKDAIEDMRKYFDNIKFENNFKCQNCYKRKLCRYCPGRNFLENGVYDTASKFYCNLADLLLEEFKEVE